MCHEAIEALENECIPERERINLAVRLLRFEQSADAVLSDFKPTRRSVLGDLRRVAMEAEAIGEERLQHLVMMVVRAVTKTPALAAAIEDHGFDCVHVGPDPRRN